MDVREALASRYSCRAFLPTPVPLSLVRDILDRARRVPSGGNLQPWRVHALSGAPLEQLKAHIRARFAELPRAEGEEYPIYPHPMKEPYRGRNFETGAALYRSLGIPREDRPARIRQYARNFEFFAAPVGLFFSIDRSLGPPQWSDLGMYILAVMLLAREHGLDSCAQESWTIWHKTLSAFLPLPPDYIVFCGLALGHGDPAAPVNQWRTSREPLDSFAEFNGFAEDAPQS
jgi:nitroreductase